MQKRLCQCGCGSALRPGQQKFASKQHGARHRKRKERRSLDEVKTFDGAFSDDATKRLLKAVVDLDDCQQRYVESSRDLQWQMVPYRGVDTARCVAEAIRESEKRRNRRSYHGPITPRERTTVRGILARQSRKARVEAAERNRKPALVAEGERVIARLTAIDKSVEPLPGERQSPQVCQVCQRFDVDCEALGGHGEVVVTDCDMDAPSAQPHMMMEPALR
jgi:hypothetical protein